MTPIGRKVLRCVEHGLRPILCVGEQLEERAGRPSRGDRHRPQLARPRSARLDRLAGTGPGDRVRAGLGDRHRRRARGADAAAMARAIRRDLREVDARWRRRDPGPVRRQRDEPTTPASSSPSRTSTARWSAAPSLKVDEMAGIVPADPACRAGAVVEDGRATGRCSSSSTASASDDDPRATRSSRRRYAALAPLLAEWPHCRLEASGEAVGLPRPDGQQRGRPPEPRRRRPVAPGPAAHRRGHRGRLFFENAGARRSLWPALASAAPAAPRRPRRTGRRPRGRPSTPSRWSSWRTGGLSDVVLSTRCSTGATRRRVRPTVPARPRASLVDGAPDGAHRDGRRSLLRHGPRPALGPHAARRTTRSSTARAFAAASAPGGHRATAYARGENDEFVQPTVIDGVRRHRARRRRRHPLQLPRRPGAAADHALARRRLRRASIAGRRPRDSAGRDADRVRGRRAAGRGRLPAARDRPAWPRSLAARLAPVPRRRDREVRPRHVLLQRRRRGALPRRGAPAGARARRSRPTTCSRR